VQPFQNVIRLPRDKTPADFPSSRLGWRIRKGRGTGTYTPSFCARYQSQAKFGGTTGYAWCARRELLERHGFYDRCIVGGGDREMALAFILPSHAVPSAELRIRAPRLRAHIERWHDAVYHDVRANIGFIPGAIHHIWHGEPASRNYEDRHSLLDSHDFDPEQDLELDEAGCWRFTPSAQPLARRVADYLGSRKEDG
jgi:hypothetical protein